MAPRKLWAVAGIVLLLAAWYAFNSESNKRERDFKIKLQKYSHDLKPGSTRQDVVKHLRANAVGFHFTCLGRRCGDRVLLGKDWRGAFPYPDEYVYAFFVYSASSPNDADVIRDAYVIDTVDVLRLSDCFW